MAGAGMVGAGMGLRPGPVMGALQRQEMRTQAGMELVPPLMVAQVEAVSMGLGLGMGRLVGGEVAQPL